MIVKNILFICVSIFFLSSCQTALQIVDITPQRTISCNDKIQMEFIGFQNIRKNDAICKNFGTELEKQGVVINHQKTYSGDFSIESLLSYPTSSRYISYIEVLKHRYVKNDSYQDNEMRKFWGLYIASCTLFTLFPVYIPLLCTGDKNKCEITYDGEYCLYIYDKQKNELVYKKPIEVFEEKVYKGEYLHKKTDREMVDAHYQRLLYNALLDGYSNFVCESQTLQ